MKMEDEIEDWGAEFPSLLLSVCCEPPPPFPFNINAATIQPVIVATATDSCNEKAKMLVNLMPPYLAVVLGWKSFNMRCFFDFFIELVEEESSEEGVVVELDGIEEEGVEDEGTDVVGALMAGG